MNKRRLLAVILSATMVVGSSMTALAADGTTSSATGAGEMEGFVDKEVLTAVLPTIGTNDLDFKLDPQHLLLETKTGQSLTVTDTTGVLFSTAASTYGNESLEFVVTNKSSVDVDITVEAKLTDLSTIEVVKSSDLAAATVPSLAMSLIGTVAGNAASAENKADTTEFEATETAATLLATAKLDGDGADYTYGGDKASGYTYTNTGSGHTEATYSFKFTGQINEVDEWKDLKSVTPGISLTWKIEKHCTAAHGKFGSGNTVVWLDLAIDAGGGIADASKLTDVKLNGSAVEYEVDASKWIKITWAQMKTAGATWDAEGTYTFTFVYDGTEYRAKVKPNP